MTNKTHEQLMSDRYATCPEDLKHIHQGYWTADMNVTELELAQTHYLEELTKLMPIKKGDFILDLGCGNGESSIWLAKKFGCFVYAIDIVTENVNRAKQAAKNSKIEHLVQVYHMDAMEMNFEVGTFDHVIAIESICHLENKESLFKKIQEVLKPGGYFALADYLLERPCSWFSSAMASSQVGTKYLKGLSDYCEMLNRANLQTINAVDVTENTLIKFLEWVECNNYELYKKYMYKKYGFLLTFLFSFVAPINDYLIMRLARNKIFQVGFIWSINSN